MKAVSDIPHDLGCYRLCGVLDRRKMLFKQLSNKCT